MKVVRKEADLKQIQALIQGTTTRLKYAQSELEIIKKKLIDKENWDFPSGPVVDILPPSARGVGSIPGWGAKIPHALWPKN